MIWVIFIGTVLFFLGIDLYRHRKGHAPSMRTTLLRSLFWMGVAAIFGLYVYWTRGREDTMEYVTAYVLEQALSLDNMFVFLLIFKTFETPIDARHQILFTGALGAVFLHLLVIYLGITLLTHLPWLIYPLGIFLILMGIRFAFKKTATIPLKFVRQWHGKAPMLVTLLAIEGIDLIFALDSVPAILAITKDPLLACTSNILAILGVRSLFFAIAHLTNRLPYLHYGLCVILVFVGIKMVLSSLYTIPTLIALAVILTIFLIPFLIPKKRTS